MTTLNPPKPAAMTPVMTKTKVANPQVAVVVPTFNEAENLPILAERLFDLNVPNLRLIVVDDASPDGTGEIAKALSRETGGRVQVIERTGKQGLGTTYVAGFAKALAEGADYVVQMDADLSHSPRYIPVLLDKLQTFDVAVGSRYARGGGVDEEWSFGRRFISSSGNFGIRTVTGVKVRDATGGFKAFRSDVLRSLDWSSFRCTGFGFQAEVAHACQRKGYRVVEHPIIFEDRTRGKSKMSVSIMVEAMWKLLPLRWSRER